MKKSLNLGPIISYFGISALEFENDMVIFEISTVEFAKLQNSPQKARIPKFGTTNAFLGFQLPRICLIAKFCDKTKMPKCLTKNGLFGWLWDKILKNYCHI